MANSAEGLARLLEELGIESTSTCANDMRAYLALLEKWNSAINLTATTEWTGLEPLFREAVLASQFYPTGRRSHLDIGSGGGFPALPLRILRPQIRLEMVESRLKRCVFLETAVKSLGISNAFVHNARLNLFLEKTGHETLWDCVSWKALRLGANDLKILRNRSHADTQFWMFHGKTLAVDIPEEFEKFFQLKQREILGTDREWYLSIYLPR